MSQFDDILAKHGIQSQEQTEDDPFDAILKKHGIKGGAKEQDGALKRGWNKMVQSVGITGALASGDAESAAQKIAESARYQQANPGTPEGNELMAAWQRGDGISGGLSEVAGEFKKDWRAAPSAVQAIRSTGANLAAMGSGVVEQIPNMILPMTGMLGGGAAGSLAGPVGMVGGAWAGASTGNTLVEGGGMAQEALHKAGINPLDTEAVKTYLAKNGDNILMQAGIKGAVIGAVDTATMGIAGKLLTGPAREATGRAMVDMGVDLTDKAAVKAAIKSPELAAKVAADPLYKAATTGAQGVTRKVTAAALVPAGEFTGEYLGQGIATGEYDEKEAFLEAASSIGQSGATFAGLNAYAALMYPFKAGKGSDASGSLPADDILTQPPSQPTAQPTNVAPQPSAAGTSPLAAPPPLNQAVPGATAFPDVNEAIQADELVQADAANPVDRMAELDAESVALAARKRELNDPANGYGPMFDAERAEIFTRQMEIAQERAELELGRTAPQPDRPVDVAPPAAPLDTAAANPVDRMAELDAESVALAARKRELNDPANGYGPMFDADRAEIFARQMEIAQERAELELGRTAPQPDRPVDVAPPAAPPAAASMDEVRRQNEQRIQRMIDLAASRGDFEPVKTSPTGTPIVGNRPVSSIPSGRIAQVLDATTNPNERIALEQEMARRGMEVPVLVEPAPPVQEIADLPEDNELPAKPAMERGDVSLSGATDNNFDVSGRTDAQLANLVKAGKPGWREAAIAEVARRNPKEALPGTSQIAQRQVNAVNKFVSSVMEQFGLSKEEAGRAWDTLHKAKVLNIDPIGGQYILKDGRFWDGEVLRNAAAIATPQADTNTTSVFDQRFPSIAAAEQAIKAKKLKQVAVFADGDQFRIGAKNAGKAAPSNNLIQRIKQLGGIHTRYRADVIGDKAGAPGLFSGNGKGLDDLATMLQAEGFAIDTDEAGGGVDALTGLIQRAVNSGKTVLNYAGQQAAAEKKLADDYRDQLKEDIAKLGGNPARNATTKQLIEMRENLRAVAQQKTIEAAAQIETLIGKELTDADWDAILNAPLPSVDQYAADLDQAALMQREQEENDAAYRRHEEETQVAAGQAATRGARQGAETGRAEPGNQEAQESREDFGLTGETPEEIRAREEAQAAKAKSEQDAADKAEAQAKKKRIAKEDADRKAVVMAEREAAKKAEVDAAVENYALGQEPPKPVEKAVNKDQLAGQGGLFAQPADKPKPAIQKSTLVLYKDGVDGEEVAFDRVPNGNESFQYALGRTESDGQIAVFRRPAGQRGSYGGWRWETDASKLKPATSTEDIGTSANTLTDSAKEELTGEAKALVVAHVAYGEDNADAAFSRARKKNMWLPHEVEFVKSEFNRIMNERKPATSTETPAGQPAATTKPTTSTNTVFTEDAAAKARAILKKKLGQLNSGLDPEIMQAGITLAGYHIEKGARTFAAYAKAMIEDLGDAVKPYLKSWYAAVTLDPRAAGMDGMDDLSSVQSADVEAILKETGDTHEPDKHSRANLERDRQDAGTQDGLGEDDVRAGTRRDGGDGEQGVRRTAQTQDQPAGGERVPGHEAAPDGAQGDFSPFAEAPGIEPGVAGSDLDQRSGDLGLFGQTIEPAGTEAADRVATGGTAGLDAKRKAQAAAQNVKTIPGNRENIREALPFLMDGQQDDVAFAEKRFSKPTGYGVLFTNGTGTGKTASGLGVIKRFERQGKTNTLIVVPSDKIAADWIEFAKNLKLDIAKLDDTKDAGQGIVITTYANFGANDALVRRKWDLVVADEAHYLSQAKDGDGTLALDKLRAITMSPRGAHTRFSVLYAKNLADLRGMSEKLRANFSIMNRDDTMDQMVDALRQENRKLEADISTLRAFLDQKRNEVRDEVDAAQGATRPRVTFLSATPFAYEKSIDYAEGYLFDYPADGKVGRSNQDGRSIFMVQHFGYRVRNHKLTEPGPEVNRGLMQRQFNSWLKSEGVLSGRMLDVSMDYDRKFILTESAIGKDIDRAMQWLWDQSNDQTNPNRAGYQTLSAAVHDTFDHLTRRYLLEAIKAKEAIPIIRQHLGMGRKVVVFHDFKKGGGFNPFRFSHSLVFSDEAVDGDDQKKNDQARAMAFNSAIDAFNAEFRELVDSPVWKSASPINALSAAFPDALLFNGDIPPKKRRENVAIFQDDESGKNLIIGQSAAMKEGVSLHDTTGKHPRVLINLGLPTQPTTSIQEEGRIFRVGQASNAIFRYLNTGTNWERWAFATTIAQRSSAAENLALGEEARALMDAYIQGFEESDAYPPGHEGEGTGGKERDRQATEALTEWDRAMTLYFAQHKRTSRDKSMEGVDYFATPEPLGLKMVEWADIRDGDKALEPSAGHGAIARWFPDNINRTVVEPSSELASRLKMVTGDARLLQEQFEQLNTAANKFDAVVMNPPFGVGGKTAIEHVAKAAQHLNNGGRIVALIPTGPAADKRFDKWFYGEEQRAIKPIDTLDYGIGPQEIYRGDAIKTNASWAPEAIILRKDAGGQSYWVKVEGRAGEIMVNKAAVTAHARSGPRTETFRPAESLYLRADIKLPQVTFERAGTRVAARVVVIEKQTNKDVAGNIQQINRDYTGSDDIKSFFERIKDAGIPERAAAHAPDSSAPATPAHTAQAVQGAMTGFKLAQTKHAIKGIDLFVATLEKKVEYDEYKRIEKAAKKHGGYYSNFARNGAVPGFQFETEENRKAFLDGFNKAEEPAATYISMAEKGQSPTGGTLLSRDDSGSRSIPWYSPLHRAVGSAKRDAMPGQQWKLWLQGNKSQLGLKDDELTYSGVLDYLELRGKEKVTKAEIADYLSGNGVTVQDVVKGGDRERFAVRRNPSSGGWQVRDPDGNWWGGYATEEDARAAGHNDIAENPTKFSGYWDSSYKGGIPGTYREILVTLPEREAAKVDDDGQISFTPEKNNAANFRSSHWDEPNVLVHVRLDEVTGADGKRYVRVGEVQSDWGQQGKKAGFRSGVARPTPGQARDYFDLVPGANPAEYVDEMHEAISRNRAPDAPFVTDTKAWVALGIKRAIMHAMDVGADGVVFGTGEQNANLYDLSKQVDRLDIEPYGIEAGVQQYRVTAMKDAAKAIDRTVAEHDLENVVGKDIAKEAIAGKTRFEGEGLRVGGEGMRAFYDQIVPQVANEVLKKIGGGKVGAVDTRPSDPNELGRWMQPGFLLPESLRTKLSENGLSLFARQPGTKGKSISLRDLTAVRDRVAARMKNLPPVHVFASPDSPGVPGNLRAFIYQQGAQNDVEGALHQGEIYMFASGLRDAVRAEQVLAEHEVTHYGLLGLLGKEGKRRVLQSIWARNARIRKRALELGKRNKINYIDATEEILADMDAKELTSLSGWRGLVLALRDWFASHGFDNIARWMNAALEGTLSDQARADLFAADLVRRARAFVENGPPRPVESSLAAMLARAWHGTPHIWAPEPGFPHGRPRLDKMGTGEGAQAFGWGWYSAESQGVAVAYKDVGTSNRALTHASAARQYFDYKRMNGDMREGRDLWIMNQGEGNAAEARRIWSEVSKNPDKYRAGQLYQLDIPDDVLPRLLDWNKPLSEQTKEVRDAINTVAAWKLSDDSMAMSYKGKTGRDFYGALVALQGSKKSASNVLARLGIVGNRYLDGQSRADGAGTYNYVIWDQPTLDKIALIERNGEKLDAMREDGAALSRKLADDLPAQEKWLNTEARMRGFKDIEDLLARDYPLFEKLAALWRKKHPAEAMMSRKATINVDGVERPTTNSNGKPIAQTVEGLRNFWRWFGDSAVADEQGRPLVAYHGTENNFSEFDKRLAGANTSHPTSRLGHYLSSSPEVAGFFVNAKANTQAETDAFTASRNAARKVAKSYGFDDVTYMPVGSEQRKEADRAGKAVYEEMAYRNRAQIMPLYLSIKNPLTLTWDEWFKAADWVSGTHEEGIKEILEKAKSGGHDGLILPRQDGKNREYAGDTYIAFEPTQIKSATGNRGTFDPANPDIRLSRAGQSQLPGVQQSPPVQPPSQQSANLQGGAAGNQSVFNTPEPSKMDDIIFKLQDKHIDLKRAIQGITDAGRQIADKWNTYMQEELFHGRTAKRVQDFADRELAPMLREMALRKVSIADLDKYLWARHAKEANALIEQRDPGVMVDDATGQPKGSGMTDQEADDYFAGLSQDQRNQLDAIARKVDGMIARTRDLYVSYGLENRDTVQGWADMFQHYVPLMREDHDGGMGIGQGFSIKGREAKHRTGSTRAVADVLANIATQRERAIVRGEKNRVAVSLAGLVKLNQAPDFWTLDKIPQERVLNEQTGLVETREVPNYRTRDNVIIAKIKDSNGNVQERAIVLNENDERAVRLAKSMKNIDIPMLEGWLGSAAAVTRYFSAINTQYNPVFGVVNLIRDTGTGALNLSSTALKGKERVVTNPRRIASAVAGIYSDARKERKGQVGTSPWATLWEEFTEEGGQTGYRDMFRTSNERANAMQQVMDPTSWTENKWGQFFTANGALKVPLVTIQKAATPLFNWLSDFNLAMENAVRLSAYKEAVDSGMSKQQAASLAKNLTVNFNRKGAWGAQAGALYAFFNAATQGTARIGETLTRRDHVTGKYSVSGVGKKIIGGGVMLGVMQAVALAMAGYDDDEPPEFIRERNIVVPLMDGKYISIPMPLGFHVLPNIGRIATETLMGRRGSAIEGVIDLMGITFEAFNPMGSAGWSTQTVLPTVFDPMAAIIENKDWTGKPIAKEKFSNTDPEPGFAMAKDNASSVSTAIAYAINLATGGSEYTAGKISPTPDQIDYLWGQVTGGVGREGNKLYQSVESLFTGEELPPHKIPLAGRLYGDTKSSSAMNSRFYDNIRDMKRHKAEYMGRMEDGDTEGAQQYLADNPEAEMIRAVGAYESKVQQLRSAKRKAIERGDSERAKEIEMMTGELMERFNQQIGAAKQ